MHVHNYYNFIHYTCTSTVAVFRGARGLIKVVAVTLYFC